MAASSPKSQHGDNNNKQKMREKQNENVVKLLTRGKLSGGFPRHLFRELPPLVRVPLQNIVTEGDRAGHTFLGFTKCGRYVLSYTQEWARLHLLYHLYWWEFNLHSKLKLVQRVQLFETYTQIIDEDLHLTVCEWHKDDSKIVIFGSGTDFISELFINVVSKPLSTPCSHCCPVPSATSTINTDSGRGGCLEHGYMLVKALGGQAVLHMEKDQVILSDSRDQHSLIACGISFYPTGEHSQNIFDTVRAAPPLDSESSEAEESSQPSSSPSSFTSTVPQGSPEGRQTFTRSPSSSPLTLSSPQEASLSDPTYVNYTHLHYCLPHDGHDPYVDRVDPHDLFLVTDLRGRLLQMVRGSHNMPCVCVEQLTLNYEALINEVIRSGTWGREIRVNDHDYDPVILEVCPETNQVMIDIGLLLSDSENTYQSNLQVSWDLNTGLCCTIGAGDLTELEDYETDYHTFNDDWKISHRKSCAKGLVVPENRYIHRMSNEALEEGMLADRDRCTAIVF